MRRRRVGGRCPGVGRGARHRVAGPDSTAAVHDVDPEFLALPLRLLADAALSAATTAGAGFADFRMERLVSADLTIRDTAVQGATDAVSSGYAVRVVVDGTWGFAVSVDADPGGRRGHRPAGGRHRQGAGLGGRPSGWSGRTNRCTPMSPGSATT